MPRATIESAATSKEAESGDALAAARRERIAAGLPWFTAGWLAIGAAFRFGLVVRGALAFPLAAVSIGLQAAVLAGAIVVTRRNPRAAAVPRIAFGACVALVALGAWFFAEAGSSVEVVVCAMLLICLGASWAFAWGWQPAAGLLALSGLIAGPVVLVSPAIHRFSDPTIVLMEAGLGAIMAIVVAEALARATGRSLRQREAERAANAQLAAAYEAYRDLAENARDLIFTHDLDGRITYVNEAFARAYGAPAAALIGRDAASLVPRDRENPDPASLRARMVAGEEIPPQVYWVGNGAGRRWLECVATPIRDSDGRIVGARGIVRDVTERREAEDALRHSLADLQRSEDRLRSLALRQASIREDERKRLGFDLHDDVCQELVGIGILAELLRRRASEEAPALAADLARITRYIGEVSEHLRQLARELRPMLLRDLGLEESLRSLADGMSVDGTTVVTDFGTAIPRLDEETEIGVYRIAQEALANAARHAGARTIRLTLAIADDTLTLEISDDGRGFAPTARRGSDALGLAGMEERALALGGRMDVTSAMGAGTQVRLTCPAARPTVSAA